MSSQRLVDFLAVNRRYARSINLERDFDVPDAVEGYILTDRAVDALRRILASMFGRKRTTAWTLTGVYGTGKSAFAHFLTSLFGPVESPFRQLALDIARNSLQIDSPEYEVLQKKFPEQGLFRAVATAQREPLRHTLVRALYKAADDFWAKRRAPEVVRQLNEWERELAFGKTSFSDRDILNVIKQLAEAVDTDIILVIDELGKSLEHATQNQGTADLYLLQQLAELSRKKGTRLYIFGLLHQSFADYGQRLAAVEKNEWAKIQGRFEDIPFTESSQQMLRLMGQAINRSQAETLTFPVRQLTKDWCAVLSEKANLTELSPKLLEATYPLHPLAAMVLPELCIRYAQNDRSLFTFLTSAEPHAFQSFLEAAEIEEIPISGIDGPGVKALPTLKLHHLYDYFVESLGAGMGSRPGLQRWLEIQTLVADAQHRGADTVALLKTIGLLNLVTSTGLFRATRPLVKLALVDQPDPAVLEYWEEQINVVTHQQGLVTYRRAVDELRLWEGSDFDVEGAIAQYIAKDTLPLADLLTETYPLKPMVAQRHSYRTGTLRYFERHYLATSSDLETLACTQAGCDGVVAYWLSETAPSSVPAQTVDGKPLVVIAAANLPLLAIRAQEYRALCQIYSRESALQSDKVALREVRHRRLQLKQLLDDTLTQAFNFGTHHNACWVEGKPHEIGSVTDFNALLSVVCDRTYPQTPILWNELINRRTLTSQGAKARRLLLEAMLEQPEVERLGLEGYGPEVAMYYSVLQQTGIHRQEQGEWSFYRPSSSLSSPSGRGAGSEGLGVRATLGQSNLGPIWAAMAEFCLGATDTPQSLGNLYQRLNAPPYGMKSGTIPVLLAAVLLHYSDEVSVYKEGTFIPVLGPEHFELLVKDPARFSVKHIEVTGVRSQVFRELEAILRGGITKPRGAAGARNLTVLSVVKPLIQFVRKLPNYTLKTRRISERSRAVLQTLLYTQEPDELLFKALPEACGLAPIVISEADDGTTARIYREHLVEALREINGAYDALLTECQDLLYSAFGVHSDHTQLRRDLQFRASRILGNCVEASLDRFARAAADEAVGERQWLEAIVMVIADKPAESWKDEDVTRFELNLSDLSRRFKNLEALQASVKATSKGGFEARRITVTRSDGTEVNKMVWANDEHQAKVDPSIDDIFSQFPDQQLREALLTRLTERMFDESKSHQEASTQKPSEVDGSRRRTRPRSSRG
ncbi:MULTISPECIES: hypothetical protein [Cyanophyceae]|uniref:hypothetical protein n=1 Tax=Cyanophyceae TaxID=3028117 RepID=UPI00168260F9|nr:MULTISPECIES: hypothetical protein [unclassified Phormidium]MBD1915005.1 hypothetical protein [Phormidium sp. FACHB-77]MBD2032792.1 hypothetical protein [Phormidium sp. FACHB-322]MBD2049937.1 hypothetical protein [Leptolyngbya sp. FACHB-60]